MSTERGSTTLAELLRIFLTVHCLSDTKPRMARLMKLKPTKGERVNIIASIAPVWKDVGYLMDLDPEGRKVDDIEAEHRQNGLHVCCRETFKLWLDSPDATWGNLIELLVDSGQKQLAKDVQDALGL